MIVKFINSKLLIVLMVSIICITKISAGINERSAQLNVSATVVPFCSIDANALAFPGYKLNAVTAKTSIILKCTNGTKYSIALDYGKSGEINNRKMRLNSNFINYQLYQDERMSKIWGNDQINSLIGTGTGETQIHKVYGVVPINQISATGVYNDLVLVNINILNSNAHNNLAAYQMMIPMNISINKL